MTPADNRRALKVGLLVILALSLLAVGTFLIGEKSNLFTVKNEYFARFRTVGGLNPGSPVQLNGVKVGSVRSIVLPENPAERGIRVEISVDRRYAGRIRKDSEARIKTLGLLGDKYVEITSGSLDAEVIPSSSEIPAAEPPGMEALMASGEDLIANVTEISSALRSILTRVQRGEGLLGELVTDQEAGKRVTDSLIRTLESVQEVAYKMEHGDGALPRLITDADLADRLESSLGRVDALLTGMQEGEGLVPALISDPTTRQRFDSTLTSLESSAASLATFSEELKNGDGALPRLLFDEEYGERVTSELEELVTRLNRIAGKLDAGDGSAARLINDPEVYDALNDIIVGVNESRLLRWLIRNRQKAGIEKRYEETRGEADLPDSPER